MWLEAYGQAGVEDMDNSTGDNGSSQGSVWIKSSFSFVHSNCVEAARMSDGRIGVRDSKDPQGGTLRFTPAEWDAFLAGVRIGEFDALADPGS
jgi:hypothetical protein